MEQETEKLYLNQMTQQGLYKLFGLRKVSQIAELDDWLNVLPELTEKETIIAEFYHNRLLQNIDSWNEQELSLGFIGPLINIIDFKIPYQLGFFAQRPLVGTVGNYELIGKPDGMLAGGHFEPEEPYFAFQEYKKDINSSGDPAGQNLAAMWLGQHLNQNSEVIYGCYIVGRLWYFMALKGKSFAISRDYSTTQMDDLLDIVKILKTLREIVLKKVPALDS